jgi:hypothetical protein
MTNSTSIDRLESHLIQLIDGMLARKSATIDFLVGLNRLDDILIEHREGQPISDPVTRFLQDYDGWRRGEGLDAAQRKRLGGFLVDLFQALMDRGDADSMKLADEVKGWMHDLGDGVFRLTLKRPKEQASLTDRFRMMMNRERDEMEMLLTEYDHLLTGLDDVLKSAEAKTDPMYRHLAASIIYFLKMEGYKVDPYVRRLRRINAETER